MEKFSVHSILSLIFLSCLIVAGSGFIGVVSVLSALSFFLLESLTFHVLPLEVSIGQITEVSSQ